MGIFFFFNLKLVMDLGRNKEKLGNIYQIWNHHNLLSRNLTLKFIFYWSSVDLQYCVSFWSTAKWFSYTWHIYMYVFFNILSHFALLLDVEYSSLYHVCAKLLQSCSTLWNPMDCSPSGSSVRRILQARILEWVAISFSRPYMIHWDFVV